MKLLWLLPAAALLLSGCTGGGKLGLPIVDPFVNSLEGYVDPFLMNHDHADLSLHAMSFHVRELAYHPLGGDANTPSGAHVLDVRGDWLFVGAHGPWFDPTRPTGGVYVFDISEPETPKLAGSFRMPGSLGGDRSMEATEDGQWIVLGTESQTCGNQVNPFSPGLYLLDARNKADIKVADYLAARGVHSVAVHTVAGVDWVVSQAAVGTPAHNVLKIDRANGKFVGVSDVAVSHDVAIFDDLFEPGKTYLYVANVADLRIYDFTNPAQLKHVSTWERPNGDDSVYVHAVAVNFTEGRRIIALESEDWDDKPSPLWVLDATDLQQPQLLKTWVNPANAPADAGIKDAGSLAFSTHNPRFENGILYLAHYHGGVWILDMRNLTKAAEPEIMGYHLPHDSVGYNPKGKQMFQNPRCPGSINQVPLTCAPLPSIGVPRCVGGSMGGFRFDQTPFVFDVEVKNGVVYAADLHSGLHVFKWDPEVAGHSH